jgi:hypothetical protein
MNFPSSGFQSYFEMLLVYFQKNHEGYSQYITCSPRTQITKNILYSTIPSPIIQKGQEGYSLHYYLQVSVDILNTLKIKDNRIGNVI